MKIIKYIFLVAYNKLHKDAAILIHLIAKYLSGFKQHQGPGNPYTPCILPATKVATSLQH